MTQENKKMLKRLRCLFLSHAWKPVADGNAHLLAYQKGDRNIIEFFSGKLLICSNCEKEKYIGPKRPYDRLTVENRNGLSCIGRTLYKPRPSIRGLQVLWPIRESQEKLPGQNT